MRRLSAILAILLLASPAVAASCLAERGARRSADLARLCRDVSPATRPPCNAENSCALIEEEIRRGCRLLGEDAPNLCGLYVDEDDSDDDD